MKIQVEFPHDDEWSEVEEFGYTKIACDWLGYHTAWVNYDEVKAVKIRVYRVELEDYQEYIYINKRDSRNPKE